MLLSHLQYTDFGKIFTDKINNLKQAKNIEIKTIKIKEMTIHIATERFPCANCLLVANEQL